MSWALPAEEYTGQNAKMIAAAKAKKRESEQGKTELIDMFESRDMNFQIILENQLTPQAAGTEHKHNVCGHNSD